MAEGAVGSNTVDGAFLVTRRGQILERIEAACARVGRSIDEIELVAVSKYVDAAAVMAASEAGYTTFAENRPQELTRKLAAFEAAGMPAPAFDMVGNLQTNKINQVLGKVGRIQSVSSLHLAQAISSRAAARLIEQRVLIEVNVSGEATKSGFSVPELTEALPALMALDGLTIEGLMTMAPAGSPDLARQTFKGLRELRDALKQETGLALETLSCGMSDDFELAIEEGSTLVRLGRIVFDPTYSADA